METTLLTDFWKDRLLRVVAEGQVPRAVKANGSFAIGTSVGSVREENQDAASYLRVRFGGSPANDYELVILCDGMGGMRGGREASSEAVARFIAGLLDSGRQHIVVAMRDAMLVANDSINRKFGGAGGTTLSAVAITRGQGLCAIHAGDSRIYSVSETGELEQISQDDTLGSLLNRGAGTELGSKLVQYVGMGNDLESHLYRLPPTNGRILLTSDGVHGVASSTLARLVRNSANSLDMVRKMLSLSDVLGGWDNATAVIAPTRISAPPLQSSDGQLVELTTPYSTFEFYLPQAHQRGHPHTDNASNASRLSKPAESEEAQQLNESAQLPTESRGATSNARFDNKAPQANASSKKRKSKAAKKVMADEQLELKAPASLSVEFPDEGK